MRIEHGCALGEAVPRPGDPTTFDERTVSSAIAPVGSPNTGGALSTELERGARLYRAPVQLSISQRVCRPAPHPHAPIQKCALENGSSVAQPTTRLASQLAPPLSPVYNGINGWTPRALTNSRSPRI